MRTSRWLFVLLAACGAALVGCAEKVKDVDRIQPHYQEKALFEGEWYYRQTVVDMPPQASFLFTGIEGDLSKVRWEIRELELIARRSHETIPGIDERETDSESFYGDPVAVFLFGGEEDSGAA